MVDEKMLKVQEDILITQKFYLLKKCTQEVSTTHSQAHALVTLQKL